MLQRIRRPGKSSRTTLLVAATLLAVGACGTQESSNNEVAEPRYDSEREKLLATCPAKAQDFFAWQQELAEKRGLNRPVHENDGFLEPNARIAQNYLLTLPVDQRGLVLIDSVRDRVIVQVSRGEDQALADLREKVEDPETVSVETVRWSEDDLATFARRIDTVPGSDSWGYGSDGLVRIEVPGDAEKARRKIAEVIPPCAFVVKGNVAPVRPT